MNTHPLYTKNNPHNQPQQIPFLKQDTLSSERDFIHLTERLIFRKKSSKFRVNEQV